MKKTLVWSLFALCLSACGAVGGADYPYANFDKDVTTVIELMKTGGKADGGMLKSAAVSDSKDLDKLWGKVKSATLRRTVHVAMRSYYWLDVETTDGSKEQVAITYSPNLGRVEINVSIL